jgi:class 3 adenylate cyclase
MDGLSQDEVELYDWLVAAGADPELAAGAIRDGRADALVSDLTITRGADLTARDVASRAGVPLDKTVLTFHLLGVAVPDVDAPQFTEGDAALIRRLATAVQVGVVRGDDLLRVVAGAMERIAEAAVAVYVQGNGVDLHRRWASPMERARSDIEATELALDLGVGLGPVFRHHMHQAMHRQRVFQEGVSRREMARLAVGFVDLVASTAMQADLDPVALGEQVSRFEARAFEVITTGGGRLVKFIGDELMVAVADPVAGCQIMVDLIDAFTDDGTQPRGGLVFGEVLFRHGDYYGPVVNLAARLVDAAIPGEALVDASVVETVKDEHLSFESAGRRMIKGLATPVSVWSLASA